MFIHVASPLVLSARRGGGFGDLNVFESVDGVVSHVEDGHRGHGHWPACVNNERCDFTVSHGHLRVGASPNVHLFNLLRGNALAVQCGVQDAVSAFGVVALVSGAIPPVSSVIVSTANLTRCGCAGIVKLHEVKVNGNYRPLIVNRKVDQDFALDGRDKRVGRVDHAGAEVALGEFGARRVNGISIGHFLNSSHAGKQHLGTDQGACGSEVGGTAVVDRWGDGRIAGGILGGLGGGVIRWVFGGSVCGGS